MKTLQKIKRKCLLPALVILGLAGVSTQLNDFEVAKNLELFSNIYRELNTYYVDEVDPEYLMETGVEAMLKSLDPYTTYIPADEVAQFRSSITGRYGGVGASIVVRDKGIIITDVYANAPAGRAGLRAGDRMLSIDGKSLEKADLQMVSLLMRGAPKSTVNLTVERPLEKEPLTFNMVREEIKVDNTPYYGILEGNIGYIVLTTFSEGAGKHVATALEDLQAKAVLKGVVLDLRGNTGGLLTEAVNVANVFLEKGEMVVQIKGREKSQQQVFRTLNDPVDTEIPVAVLIDRQTASASEIVAGALQDLDRGVIIGQRSFGKGLVQNTRDLSFGAKVKLTTARYYIPSGRCIQALEYKNGKPKQISEDLKTPYQTKGGRPVYDGGGIKPDVKLDKTRFLELVGSLNTEWQIFDYVTNYTRLHKTIPAASEFQLGDEDFEDFMVYLKKNEYTYKSKVALLLDKMNETAAKETFETALSDQQEALEAALVDEGTSALKSQKAALLHLLQRLIAERYYHEKGGLEAGQKSDQEILEARLLLLDQKRYKDILSL